jgi:hypothetical protein
MYHLAGQIKEVRWVGYVARKGVRSACEVLVESPEGKSQLEGSVGWWEDNT